MPAVSSFFLVLALVLAVVIGPQTRAWSWGPALVALGFSVAAALPSLWRKNRTSADFGLVAFGSLVAGWFAWRAWSSPVAEFGSADLILLTGVVGTFVSIRAIEGNLKGERILSWGVALLLLANILVIWKQVLDPSYAPIFSSRAAGFPSGFYAHYNEAANYLIASSLLVAASSLFGKHTLATRLFFGLVAICGLTAVYYTRSRGGILGAATGAGVLALASLMIGRRDKAAWFAPAIIAIPVVGLILGGFLYMGWQDSQAIRLAKAGGVTGDGIEQLMDNNGRLYLLGIALSCIALHPLVGGGSRSFSWESFRFTEGTLQGDIITHVPDLVHNELLQAATDYGIIGAALLIILLAVLAIMAVIRLLFSESGSNQDSQDAWRLGGLAALAGMFFQSCFSFVFHLLPGGILLGICLGLLSRTKTQPANSAQLTGARILMSLAALASLGFLLPAGLRGSQITRILWPTYFSKTPLVSTESRIDALSEAIRIWPQPTLYQERALIYQNSSLAAEGPSSREMQELSISDYEEAGRLNPFDPNPVINRANLLGQLGKDSEAEEAYYRAIQLQGGMEPAFRAHFSLAKHLIRKGVRQFSKEAPEDALATLEIGAQQMEESIKLMHWIIPDMVEPRVSAHERLGAAREANGDYSGAMQAYDFAATLHGGKRVHYLAGTLNGKLAAAAWSSRRSGEALGYFIEAKRRIDQAAQFMPDGVTPSQRIEYIAHLDKAISFLKGARIEPIAPSN